MIILSQLPEIIKKYPWTIEITIGNMKAKVDEHWHQKIIELLCA
jgi:hypothetical protein